MPSRRLWGEYFLLPFSAYLRIGNRCLATSIPHPSHTEMDAEKHKQGVASQVFTIRLKAAIFCGLLAIFL